MSTQNNQKSPESWFDLGNYDDLEPSQEGLAWLARLLSLRADLFDAIPQCANSNEYQQIIAGDPLFINGPLRLLKPPVTRPGVWVQSPFELLLDSKLLDRKFSKPLQEVYPQDLIELGATEEDINPVLQAERPNRAINFIADLRAPKEKLLEDFDKLILQEKGKYELNPEHIRKNTISCRQYFKLFTKYKVLPYLDLNLWSKVENNSLLNTDIGKLLYGDEYTSSEDKRLVEHTIPHSEKARDRNTIDLMWYGQW